MNDAVKKTFLLKIIPPDGYSVYRVTFTRRHLVSIAAIVFALLLGAVGLHTYQLKVAEANLKALQAITARQQSQLRQIDSQADALAGELRAVQKENAAIRQLIGGDKDGKHQHAMIVVPRANGAEDFARVQARLRHLASASQATRADAARLQRLVLRVLNLRRLATIARERMIAAIPSIMPANGYVASGFGWRNNPWPEFHKGVDLAADYGATVRAAASGTVASAGWDPGGFGNKVDIDHGNGYHTWYAHLARIAVSPGQRVTKGEPIASVGSTGESTGPHLHYQVMKDGVAIDPQPFLSGVPQQVMATLPEPGGVQ